MPDIRRPAFMLPIIETVMRDADQRLRVIADLRPCFGWQYHDLDADMRPLPTTCPRDGTGPDERRMCEVRPFCAQAWDEAAAMRVKSSSSHDELTRPTKGRAAGIRPARRSYYFTGRPADKLIHALNLKLGLPPILYDRDWHIRSKSAAAWARANLGPLFIVAPSSYHSYIGHIPQAPNDYFLLARAWTTASHALRVDLMPELADAVQRSESLKKLLDPIPPSKHVHSRFPGARYRVIIADQASALALGAVILDKFALNFGELAAWGARWRNELPSPQPRP